MSETTESVIQRGRDISDQDWLTLLRLEQHRAHEAIALGSDLREASEAYDALAVELEAHLAKPKPADDLAAALHLATDIEIERERAYLRAKISRIEAQLRIARQG